MDCGSLGSWLRGCLPSLYPPEEQDCQLFKGKPWISPWQLLAAPTPSGTFCFNPSEEIMTQHHGCSHFSSIRWLDPWEPRIPLSKGQLLQPFRVTSSQGNEACTSGDDHKTSSHLEYAFSDCLHPMLPYPEWCPTRSKAHSLENQCWTLNRDELTHIPSYLPTLVP